ncbi:GrpB domain, predicted nucleotidyltransferase, UPF0157 family [Acetitomaculum ruminis DSM 5522]|uniref:GrpB domain, predicted nucleotidyltransferase, UPF0157 family n=1 Tax=Acetitomaculum ruminis DSM 5522 TaxID=1120918 RepID=A0A1I1AN41_9FIRM|nr:GNAT family N-acetyltransferase [Acetitomaculum ruminis]SFB39434.1 GrpB domain, predicted nucleotidyltransferase, UPF0157 family [Acetitomaculum ruminis DSM 5522]
MRTKYVKVLPYDTKWKNDFIKIKNEIKGTLGSLAVSIEHVGSTAVEGLAAKPIIDIDIVVREVDVDNVIKILEDIGYFHEGNLGIEGREAFSYEKKEHLRTHHLYLCPENSEELRRHIAFRDYLINHKEDMIKYSKIKIEAARLFPHDIDKYIEFKTPIINQIYEQMNYKFRKAKISDLSEIKRMYLDIIDDMKKNGIDIWDDYYPCELFEEDITNNSMYVLLDGDAIVAAFVTSRDNPGACKVKWQYNDNEILYMDRLGVNVNYKGKGIGSRMLSECENIALKQNATVLRFFVVDCNEPAIRLYEKCGFLRAAGIYEEVIDEELVLNEYGYEKNII